MGPARTNAASTTATEATESSHHALIVGPGRTRAQAPLGLKTKRRRKWKGRSPNFARAAFREARSAPVPYSGRTIWQSDTERLAEGTVGP